MVFRDITNIWTFKMFDEEGSVANHNVGRFYLQQGELSKALGPQRAFSLAWQGVPSKRTGDSCYILHHLVRVHGQFSHLPTKNVQEMDRNHGGIQGFIGDT